jgi:hypothetical protein
MHFRWKCLLWNGRVLQVVSNPFKRFERVPPAGVLSLRRAARF